MERRRCGAERSTDRSSTGLKHLDLALIRPCTKCVRTNHWSKEIDSHLSDHRLAVTEDVKMLDLVVCSCLYAEDQSHVLNLLGCAFLGR